MVGGTRSGRVTRNQAAKPPAAAPTGPRVGSKPTGVTRSKAKPPPKAKAVRGRGKKGVVAAAADQQAEFGQGQTPTVAPEDVTRAAAEETTNDIKASSPAPQPPSKPKVIRVFNEIWATTPASIAFALDPTLSTNDDTNTIALNLMDHIIKPQNWNPQLSYNVLSAACFFFASQVTGLKGNTPDRIAGAMKVDIHVLEGLAGPQIHHNPVMRARLAEALRVGPEDVKKGDGILFAHRERLKEYVGEYAEELEKLPHPDEIGKMEVQSVMKNMGWKEGEVLGKDGKGIASPVKAANGPLVEAGLGYTPPGFSDGENEEKVKDVVPSAEAPIEAEKASEVELDLDLELDEFDTFVAENE